MKMGRLNWRMGCGSGDVVRSCRVSEPDEVASGWMEQAVRCTATGGFMPEAGLSALLHSHGNNTHS